MKTKSQLLNDRSWLQDLKDGKGGDLVVGGDLDGWISALILTNHNAIVRGVYNNRELALDKNFKGEDVSFIDHDIARPNVRSIGHHITSYSKQKKAAHLYHPEGVQINDLYDTSFKDKDAKRNIAYKYPFSTALFLLWLFDYDLMKFSGWQRYLVFQADGVISNFNRYPHSTQEWIKRVFGAFLSNPMKALNMMESSCYAIDFRKLRSEHIHRKTKGEGQGKGIEKTKNIEITPDGKLTLDQKDFIVALGKEIGFPFKPENWKCWDNMRLHKFKPNTCPKAPAGNYNKLLQNPETLISLIFSNTQGKIDYTSSDVVTISNAFGIIKDKPQVITQVFGEKIAV